MNENILNVLNADGTRTVGLPVVIPGDQEPAVVITVIRTKSDMIFTGFENGLLAVVIDTLMAAARIQFKRIVDGIAAQQKSAIEVVPAGVLPHLPPNGGRTH